MTIGEKLAALRQRKGLTQEELCKDFNRRYPAIKITRKQYGHWESDTRNPQLMHFKAMVTYYRVSADELLFDHLVPGSLTGAKKTRKAKSVLQ